MSQSWQKVTDLFHGALERPPGERAAFLDAACGDDAALRREVASLLACHDQAATFLEQPAADLASSMSDLSSEASLVGRRLGHYTILRRLGHGGMGIVYLAEDTRLARMVALKALAPRHTLDERRRERLRREARAAAALTHPGIATVYALEEIDEHLYIASEYVPGETLRQELARGPLPLAVLMDTAAQIAGALAAAHERGVIHRDLKPENVMRGPDGQIKILDFGLARFYGPDAATGSAAFLTDEGAILGTPAYMSPEQLRGREVDARTDVFSFGVVLFELAAGAHPFAADSPASMIARTLESDPPDLAKLMPALPAALTSLVRGCLAKDRDTRVSSMREALRQLEDCQRQSSETAPAPSRGRARTARPATARSRRLTPRWWWQVHQIWAGSLYFLNLVPIWIAMDWMPRPWGSRLFIAAVAIAAIGGNLRWHLSFTSRYYPDQLAAQRARLGKWVAASDIAYAALTIFAAAAIVTEHVFWGSYFLTIGIALLLGLTVIEPATTRAAFDKTRGGRRKTPSSA